MSHQMGGQTGTCHLAGYPVNQSLKLVCHGIATTSSITAETQVSFLNLSLNSSFTITYKISTKAKKTGRAHSLSDSLISESWKHQTNENKHYHWRKSTSISQVQTKSKILKLKAGRSSLCAGQNSTASVSLWPHSDKRV